MSAALEAQNRLSLGTARHPPARLNLLEIVGNAIAGGMETCVLRFIERLPPDQVCVTVMCPFQSQFTDRLRALHVDVVIASMPEDPPWSSIQLAHTLVRAKAIDVIHAHMSNAHTLAGLVGKLAGKPVLATIHGRQLGAADLEVHRSTDTHLSVVCQHTYYHALGLGVNAARLALIPNGVDTAVFVPRSPAPQSLRLQLGIAAHAPLAGFVGRLSWEKGPDVFLRAALGAHQLLPQAHFVVIGEGPMLEQLRHFTAQFGLQQHVHFAGLQSDMPEVLPQLDLLVSSSHSEAMPLAVMEAMSCGLPVLATRAGGVPDLIQHGGTGWLVGIGDFEALSRQTAHLLDTPAERLAMGLAARQRALAHFSLAERVQETTALLYQLTQAHCEQRRINAVPAQHRTHAPHAATLT